MKAGFLMVFAVAAFLVATGCTSPSGYTGAPRQQFDANTQYNVIEQREGFTVITYTSRYQFIPESDVVADSAKSAAIRIAQQHLKELGKPPQSLDDLDVVVSTGRNGLSGMTRATATVNLSFPSTPLPATDYTAENFPIKAYQFDASTRRGSVAVDIGDKGFSARLWVVKNIGMICSSKNIAMEAGRESFSGAKYTILDESLESSLLTIVFEATY